MKKGKTFMFLNVKRVVNITALSFLLATSISYAKDKEETLTLATFPTYEEFHQKDLEHFRMTMAGVLLGQGFEKDDLADIVEMFIGEESIEDIDDAKDYVERHYNKKITTNSKDIFYNLPSFENYKYEILKLLNPETNPNIKGADIIKLAKKVEKSSKGKYKKFIADLYELGESYIKGEQLDKENAQLDKENAQLDKENAQLDKENAQLDKKNAKMKEILNSLNKNFGK